MNKPPFKQKKTMIEQAEPEQQQPANEMTQDQLIICDIFMRILAGHPPQHCMNILFSVINTYAMLMNKQGRDMISQMLLNLSKSIESITDEQSAAFIKQGQPTIQ